MKDDRKKPNMLFSITKKLVEWAYPKITLCGTENLPEEPFVLVGNHTQINGPIISEICFNDNYYTWCASQMMSFKEVPAYAFKDFWSQKPKWTWPFYKLLSYIIAPVSVFLFNNAKTIPVYRDKRVFSTFKETVKLLAAGKNIIIFPEQDIKHNNILYEFQDRFIDVARLYKKRTGKELKFVPMYIAPKLKSLYFGKAIEFNSENEVENERRRVATDLMDAITDIATALPSHTVVPYRNIPKKDYPKNKIDF